MQHENEIRRRSADAWFRSLPTPEGQLEATDEISSSKLRTEIAVDFEDQIIEPCAPKLVAGTSVEGSKRIAAIRDRLEVSKKGSQTTGQVNIEKRQQVGSGIVAPRKKLQHPSRRRARRRRHARIDEEELRANIKRLAPIYRRRIFIEQLRKSWYWFAVVAVGVIGVTVAVTFFFLPGNEKVVEVNPPPTPIKGRWGIVRIDTKKASAIVEDLRTNNTPAVREIEDGIKDVYLQARVEAEKVTLFHFPSNRQSQTVNKDSVILDHTVYLAPNISNDINDTDMKSLIHLVRKALSRNKSWVFDPNVLSVKRGASFAKASSVDTFVQSKFPPLDLKVRPVKPVKPKRISSCRALPKERNSVVTPEACHNRLKTRSGLSCTTTCEKGHVLSGSKLRTCLSNGIWSGWRARCEVPCPHLKYPSNGIVSPRSCVAEDGVDKPFILGGHNCFFFCNPGCRLIGSVRTTCQSDGRWSTVPSICKKTCPGLTPPANGHVVPVRCSDPWVSEESFCTFFCDDEYVIRGDQTTSCLNDGTWTSEVPFCSTVCYKLPQIPNAKVHPSVCWLVNTEAGMRCLFECDIGYQLIGSKERMCNPSGGWSGSSPSCIKKCPRLGHRKNLLGSHDCAFLSANPGTTCSFSCEAGFQTTGQKDLVCLKDGSWNIPMPTCTAVCPSILQPTVGHIICSGNIEKSDCSLYCPNKHVLIGAQSVVCTRGGSWSEPIGYCLNTCKTYVVPTYASIFPAACGLQVSNAGETCRFECQDGYAISGAFETQCLDSGTWSKTDTLCVPERQYLMEIETVFRKMCLKWSPGSSYVVKEDWDDCKKDSRHAKWALMPNRLIRNTEANMCLATNSTLPMALLQLKPCNGNDGLQIWDWSDFGESNYYLKLKRHQTYLWESYNSLSRIITVDKLALVKSTWKLQDVLRGKTLSFFGAFNNGKCSPLVNSANGEWTPAPCWTTGVNSGSSCVFVCKAAFSLLEVKVETKCDNGIWAQHKTPHCTESCPGLVAPTGSSIVIQPAACTQMYVKEEMACSATCAAGAVLIGEQNMLCLRGGTWTFALPKCEIVCPTLVVVANGSVTASPICTNFQGYHLHQSQCEVTCDEGYVLSTPSIFQCNTGVWNHPAPVCRRKCELPENEIKDGSLSCSITTVPTEGDTCVVTCDSNYAPDANSTLVCLSSGTWTSNVPRCKKQCPALANHTGLTFLPNECNNRNGVFEGTVCVAYCAAGYALIGSSRTSCLDSGTWSGRPIECVAVAAAGGKFLMIGFLDGNAACISVQSASFYSSNILVVKDMPDCDITDLYDQWIMMPDGRIRNVASRQCLGISGPLRNYAPIQPQSCYNSNSEKWRPIYVSAVRAMTDETGKYYLYMHQISRMVIMYDKFVADDYRDKYMWVAKDMSGKLGSISGIGQSKCPILPLPDGAWYSPADAAKCQSQLVSVGDSCTVFCPFGRQMNVPDPGRTFTCDTGGIWSTVIVKCIYETCPPIVLFPNSVVNDPTCVSSSSPTSLGSRSCNITCLPGYIRISANPYTISTKCLENGRWSDLPPRCVLSCPTLSDPTDGNVTSRCSNTSFTLLEGDVCVFTCNIDFELSGNGTLECVGGAWSNPSPTCQRMVSLGKKCSRRSATIYNGTVIPSGCGWSMNSAGQTCTLHCGTNSISSQTWMYCQLNGEWSNELLPCTPACPKFVLIYTQVVMVPKSCYEDYVPAGQRCFMDCERAHQITDQLLYHHRHIITCRDNSTWDASDPNNYMCGDHIYSKIKSNYSELCLAAPSPDLVIFTSCSRNDWWMKWLLLEHTVVNRAHSSLCLTLDSVDTTLSSVSLQSCEQYDTRQRWDCGAWDRSGELQNPHGWKLTVVIGTNRVFAVAMRSFDNSLIGSTYSQFHPFEVRSFYRYYYHICDMRRWGRCSFEYLEVIEQAKFNEMCRDAMNKSLNFFVGADICDIQCNPGYTLLGAYSFGSTPAVCEKDGSWNFYGPTAQCLLHCPARPLRSHSYAVSGNCTSPVFAGTVCKYKCQAGYISFGYETVMCMRTGEWSDGTLSNAGLVCYLPCNPISRITGSDISPSKCTSGPVAPGTSCSTVCHDGYKIAGRMSQLCQSDGSWNFPQATCTILCSTLPSVTNGDIVPSGCVQRPQTGGSQCVYRCDTGYGLVGTVTRKCLGNGLWSGVVGKCLRSCSPLAAPTNGAWTMVSSIVNVAGAIVKATCISNYAVDKDPVRTCLHTGRWSGDNVNCIKEQQFILFQSSPPARKICIYADSIFTLKVRPLVECERSAWYLWAWKNSKNIRNVGTGKCLHASATSPERYLVLRDCDQNDVNQNWTCNPIGSKNLFSLADSDLVPVYSTLSASKVLLLSEDTFQFVGEKSIATVAHLQWSVMISNANQTSLCSAKKVDDCPGLTMNLHLDVTTNVCRQTEVPVGTQCFFQCQNGYVVKGTVVSTTCTTSGAWSEQPPLCIASCSKLTLSSGITVQPGKCVTSSTFHEGEICQFFCPTNDTRVGDSLSVCMMNGQWSAKSPVCKATCNPLKIPIYGQVRPDACADLDHRMVEDTQCTLSCLQIDHVLSGSNTRTCLSNGEWSGFDSDCVKPCFQLFQPSHTVVSPLNCIYDKFPVGSICSFKCEPGFLPNSVHYRTCQNDSTWSGGSLSCRKHCSPMTAAVANGIIHPLSCTHQMTEPDKQCGIRCNSGFDVVGSKTITCTSAGTWSGALGVCKRKCPVPRKPRHGSLTPTSCLGQDIFTGTTCSPTCERNYILKGSAVRTCTSTGQWTGTDAECVLGCFAVGAVESATLFPPSCVFQHQPLHGNCSIVCDPETLAPDWGTRIDLTCLANGLWSRPIPKRCLRSCVLPMVENGWLECDGKTVAGEVLENQKCEVKCEAYHMPTNHPVSTCVEGAWLPAVTMCSYNPYPLLMVQRIDLDTKCIGVKGTNVILRPWKQCRENVRTVQWSWKNRYNVMHLDSGLCLTAFSVDPDAPLILSPCDLKDELQRWDCDADEPYRLFLYESTLGPGLLYEGMGEVTMQEMKVPTSLFYTFNPQSDDDVGTLCSLRPEGGCQRLAFPVGVNVNPSHCTLAIVPTGTVCRLSCDVESQSISGASTFECKGSGLWSPETLGRCLTSCQPLDPSTADPAFFKNWQCVSERSAVDDVCRFACQSGFYLKSDFEGVRCLENGEWTEVGNVQCLVECPQLQSPENGKLTPEVCTSGKCAIVCNVGYKLDGPRERTCENGRWSESDFSCAKEAQFPISTRIYVLKMRMCLTVVDSNLVVKNKCVQDEKTQMWRWHAHYALENVATETCLTFRNRTIDITPRAANSSEEINDVVGYNNFRNSSLPGELFVTPCNASDAAQRWECDTKSAINRFRLVLIELGLYLDSGPQFTGRVILTHRPCHSSRWVISDHEGISTLCSRRSTGVCLALGPLYSGTISPTVCVSEFVTVGTTCHFRCTGDFVIEGSQSTVCRKNGFWTNDQPVCLGIGRCPALAVKRPLLARPPICAEKRVPVGRSCTFRCSDTHILYGSEVMLCDSSLQWPLEVPVCRFFCPPLPSPAGGLVSPESCQNLENEIGKSCEYTCFAGYNIIGFAERVCQEDGSWSGSKTVCRKLCPILVAPANATISPESCTTNKSMPGAFCSIMCDAGYRLAGSPTTSCVQGEWSDDLPVCSGDNCPRYFEKDGVKSLSYRKLVNNAIARGTVLEFLCSAGFRPSNGNIRTCGSDGVWVGSLELCKPFACRPMARLYHGRIVPASCATAPFVNTSIICAFFCEEGFILSGPTSAECLPFGVWSVSEAPECHDTYADAHTTNMLVTATPSQVNITASNFNAGQSPTRCLVAREGGSKAPVFDDCFPLTAFKLWRWFGSFRVQNVANQLCWGLDQTDKLILEKCVLNVTSQVVFCGDVSSEFASFQVFVNEKLLSHNLRAFTNKSAGDFHWAAMDSKIFDDATNTIRDLDSSMRPRRVPLCTFMCGGLLSAEEGDFSTPNYPAKYPSDVTCRWTIHHPGKVVRIDFSSLKLSSRSEKYAQNREHCFTDELLIFEGVTGDKKRYDVIERVCASRKELKVKTIHGSLHVELHSDHNAEDNQQGLAAKWFSEDSPPLLPTCGVSELTHGDFENATLRGFPWQIAVSTWKRLCDGVFIGSRFALTSAHCVEHVRTANEILRIFMAYRIKTQNEFVTKLKRQNWDRADRLWIHPEYSREAMRNNLAVLRLEIGIIELEDDLQPACLPDSTQGRVERPGDECVVSGLSKSLVKEPSQKWRFTRIARAVVLSQYVCETLVQSERGVTFDRESFLCAELFFNRDSFLPVMHENGAIDNDGGSALQCYWNENYYVAGIFNFALGDVHDGVFYVFTKTVSNHEWIKDTVINGFLKSSNIFK